MPLSNPELWQRIADYPMPRSLRFRGLKTPAPDFEGQLVQDLSISPLDAARLVREYKKFLYLKAIDGGLLAPPPDLDEVWHLHIDSADGAWDSFCRTVIGAPLEHRTRLPRATAKAAYARLIALYEGEFGARPSDIRPSPTDLLQYRIGLAVIFMGIVIAFGGHLAMMGAQLLGHEPPFSWIPYTFFGGLGVTLAGFLISRGTRVARISDCG
jgi:hypothetical protein